MTQIEAGMMILSIIELVKLVVLLIGVGYLRELCFDSTDIYNKLHKIRKSQKKFLEENE